MDLARKRLRQQIVDPARWHQAGRGELVPHAFEFAVQACDYVVSDLVPLWQMAFHGDAQPFRSGFP
jgi:hypothetical protein